MRKLLTLVLGVAACFGASAQYISLQQGTTLEYKSTLYQDKDSMTLNTVAKIFKCYRGPTALPPFSLRRLHLWRMLP